MTQTPQQWQEEWQRGDGKGVTPCRQVLLIADLAEATQAITDLCSKAMELAAAVEELGREAK